MPTAAASTTGTHKREPNPVGCKPNWCTNWCYCIIGNAFISMISSAGQTAAIIGMWALAPDLISSVIWALGPPKMTGAYKDDVKESLISYPPA